MALELSSVAGVNGAEVEFATLLTALKEKYTRYNQGKGKERERPDVPTDVAPGHSDEMNLG